MQTRSSDHPPPAGGHRGVLPRLGLRRYIEDTQESFDVFEVSLSDVRAVGDKAVGWGTVRFRGRGSGIETEVTTAAVATVRGGHLLHFKDYGDRKQALEAAGLSE